MQYNNYILRKKTRMSRLENSCPKDNYTRDSYIDQVLKLHQQNEIIKFLNVQERIPRPRS